MLGKLDSSSLPAFSVHDHYRIISVGALYLWSADSIRKGTANGLETALGTSWFEITHQAERNLYIITRCLSTSVAVVSSPCHEGPCTGDPGSHLCSYRRLLWKDHRIITRIVIAMYRYGSNNPESFILALAWRSPTIKSAQMCPKLLTSKHTSYLHSNRT